MINQDRDLDALLVGNRLQITSGLVHRKLIERIVRTCKGFAQRLSALNSVREKTVYFAQTGRRIATRRADKQLGLRGGDSSGLFRRWKGHSRGQLARFIALSCYETPQAESDRIVP